MLKQVFIHEAFLDLSLILRSLNTAAEAASQPRTLGDKKFNSRLVGGVGAGRGVR
jgi:hypothetical protein